LGIERCPVKGIFTGADVMKAISAHTLEKSTWSGTYSINPKAR
jgi:hypothetical protein